MALVGGLLFRLRGVAATFVALLFFSFALVMSGDGDSGDTATGSIVFICAVLTIMLIVVALAGAAVGELLVRGWRAARAASA